MLFFFFLLVMCFVLFVSEGLITVLLIPRYLSEESIKSLNYIIFIILQAHLVTDFMDAVCFQCGCSIGSMTFALSKHYALVMTAQEFHCCKVREMMNC